MTDRQRTKEVLAEHRKWLNGDGGSRADLSRADLRGADLRGADLSRADLSDAVLRGADLRGADLSDAVLRGADLSRAVLRGADLRGADLSRAVLRGADLRGADLSRADLSDAVLRGADLSRADLSRAVLRGADLRGADLSRAVLRGADLRGADLSDARGLAFQIPQEGELIVWKSVWGGIAKLRIPAEAKRTGCLINRKCRAEWVETLAIFNKKTGNEMQTAHGRHDRNTVYTVGEVTRPDSYDDDIRVDCTHGIHFWLSREEAEEWL